LQYLYSWPGVTMVEEQWWCWEDGRVVCH